MRYLSIDIETTGLDETKDSILSIGIIFEDTDKELPYDEIPKLHLYIQQERIEGSLFAVNMNREIIERLCHYSQLKTDEAKESFCDEYNVKVVKLDEAVSVIHNFMWDNGLFYDDHETRPPKNMNRVGDKLYPNIDTIPKTYINVAGKNFGTFDKKFLELIPKWKRVISVRSRILDPGIYFVDWEKDDQVPGLSECKKRAGLNDFVSHDAVDDAWDVVQLIRIGRKK